MGINKKELLKAIMAELVCIKSIALAGAKQAHDTATHTENAPESRYDTLGLEGAYLAHGQTQRVMECEADIDAFKNIKAKDFSVDDDIRIGALVCLQARGQSPQYLFLSPASGGVSVQYQGMEMTLVTPSSPMGKALLGKYLDDDVELIVGGQKKSYRVESLF